MFVLGHLGIGKRLGERFVGERAIGWMLLGALLPDLIDKPLYYALALATGRRGAALGLISGTRTFGHTAILPLLVWLLARLLGRRRQGSAVAVGMATHLLLDELGDFWPTLGPPTLAVAGPPTLHAILWPLLGTRFPAAPFGTLSEHVATLASGYVVTGELVGAALLAWDLWIAPRRRARHLDPSKR